MRVCGIKVSHDACIAGIEDDNLIFSVEEEKINNQQRHAIADSFDNMEKILESHRFWPDIFVLDGSKRMMSPNMNLPSASYHNFDDGISKFERRFFENGLFIHGQDRAYASHPHIFGHVIGSYVSADFAGLSAYSIVWDGGYSPKVHYIDASDNSVRYVGTCFDIFGTIYETMGLYFGPYKAVSESLLKTYKLAEEGKIQVDGRIDWPGKLMAYIAHGKPCKDAIEFFCLRFIIDLR